MNKALLTTGLMAALLLTGWFGANSLEPPPERGVMKAYRLTLLSDDQVRSLLEKARDRATTIAEQAKSDFDQAINRHAEHLRNCSDAVYRARNDQSCNVVFPIGLMAGPLKSPTAEQIFDEAVLGECAYVESARAARKARCMP